VVPLLVVLGVSSGAKEKGITAGIAVGAVIGLEAMFAGPICGASMNPARSLAPAVVSGHFEHLWVYLTAPILGATVAVPTYSALANGRREAAGGFATTGRLTATVRQEGTPMTLPRVLFVCVENSNRSQMAEAFARIHGAGKVDAASSGSRPRRGGEPPCYSVHGRVGTI